MTTRDILQHALTALEYHRAQTRPIYQSDLVIEALRGELAKPEGMTIKQTSNKEATVSPNLHWIPIGDDPPPTGSKVLVIDDQQRIAYLRDYMPRQGWTHYFPLPTFKK